MRTLCISDIHGCINQFNKLLELVEYDSSKDKLILLGDYVDRGLHSKDVLEKVIDLHKNHGAIVLKGNHDDMFVKAIRDKEDELWIYNGGITTVQSYYGSEEFQEGFDWTSYENAKRFIIQHYGDHLHFLDNLPLYHEDEHHIFVHAGINPFYDNWRDQPEQDFIWIRDIFHKNVTNLDKKVVFGHTPTKYLHDKYDIWFDKNEDKIGLDGAMAYGGQLNCLEINEQGYKVYSVSSRGESN